MLLFMKQYINNTSIMEWIARDWVDYYSRNPKLHLSDITVDDSFNEYSTTRDQTVKTIEWNKLVNVRHGKLVTWWNTTNIIVLRDTKKKLQYFEESLIWNPIKIQGYDWVSLSKFVQGYLYPSNPEVVRDTTGRDVSKIMNPDDNSTIH